MFAVEYLKFPVDQQTNTLVATIPGPFGFADLFTLCLFKPAPPSRQWHNDSFVLGMGSLAFFRSTGLLRGSCPNRTCEQIVFFQCKEANEGTQTSTSNPTFGTLGEVSRTPPGGSLKNHPEKA